MKKEGIQTRKRKPKTLNKTKGSSGELLSKYISIYNMLLTIIPILKNFLFIIYMFYVFLGNNSVSMTPTSTSSSNSEDCSKTSSPSGQVSGVSSETKTLTTFRKTRCVTCSWLMFCGHECCFNNVPQSHYSKMSFTPNTKWVQSLYTVVG